MRAKFFRSKELNRNLKSWIIFRSSYPKNGIEHWWASKLFTILPYPLPCNLAGECMSCALARDLRLKPLSWVPFFSWVNNSLDALLPVMVFCSCLWSMQCAPPFFCYFIVPTQATFLLNNLRCISILASSYI